MTDRLADKRPNALVDSIVLADESGTRDHPDYGVRVGLTYVRPGGHTGQLWHAVPEVVFVLGGVLLMESDGDAMWVRSGDSFTIPPGCWHSFKNTTRDVAIMLFVFGGDPDPVTRWQESLSAEGGEANPRPVDDRSSLMTGHRPAITPIRHDPNDGWSPVFSDQIGQ